ncbi:hypothetical protein M758_5G126000 [Ceratodon purpureus]|nr:hypothetical protein M758_5G126000 [Ceratodon purpureus]
MCNLSRRQSQVEQDVPSLEDQLIAIKDALHNFDICEPMYMELKSIPEQRRTAREHILIMAYEKYQYCREEIQELRMSRDTSRSDSCGDGH